MIDSNWLLKCNNTVFQAGSTAERHGQMVEREGLRQTACGPAEFDSPTFTGPFHLARQALRNLCVKAAQRLECLGQAHSRPTLFRQSPERSLSRIGGKQSGTRLTDAAGPGWVETHAVERHWPTKPLEFNRLLAGRASRALFQT